MKLYFHYHVITQRQSDSFLTLFPTPLHRKSRDLSLLRDVRGDRGQRVYSCWRPTELDWNESSWTFMTSNADWPRLILTTTPADSGSTTTGPFPHSISCYYTTQASRMFAVFVTMILLQVIISQSLYLSSFRVQLTRSQMFIAVR